jgi:hypothetical protein
MEHVPALTIVKVFPATAHMADAFETKLTVRPELADAVRLIGGAPMLWLLREANVIIRGASFLL